MLQYRFYMEKLLDVPLTSTVKSLVLATDSLDESGQVVETQIWLLLVRGDHDLNEVKVCKVPGLKGGFRFATGAEIAEYFDGNVPFPIPLDGGSVVGERLGGVVDMDGHRQTTPVRSSGNRGIVRLALASMGAVDARESL